jgi:dolichyl-diphosphooligosaccharide--protein glycosyltransferase
VLLCLCFSAYARYGQYEVWKTAPEVYFSRDVPMMSTLDAYYWLRLAREYKEAAHTGGPATASKGGSSGGPATASKGGSTGGSTAASTGGSKNLDVLRHFPESWPYDDPPPLLSILVADVSSMTGLSVYDAGNLLVVLLSGLFIVPLAAYFFIIGSPAAGILGGLTGTFSIIYFTRTSIGRIDNDMLNLFFLFFAALLTLLAATAVRKRKSVLYSAVLGVVMMLFYRWYSQPFFPIGQFFMLVVMLFIHRNSGKGEGIEGDGGWRITIPVCSAAYIAAYGVSFGLAAAHLGVALKLTSAAAALALSAALYYVSGRARLGRAHLGRARFGGLTAAGLTASAAVVVVLLLSFAGFLFMDRIGGIYESVSSRAAVFVSIYVKSDAGDNAPGVYNTITETRKNTAREIFSYVYSSPLLSVVCIFSFAAFFVFNRRWMLPLLPAFVMGLMSFKGANRFVMYLAPFAGAGAGLSITAAVAAFAKIKPTKNILFLKKSFQEAAGYLLALLFFIATYNDMGASHVPLPSVPADVYSALAGIRGKLPKNSGVFTWWDFGYAVQEAAGVATFIDGGYQPNELIRETARALTSPDQNALHAAAKGKSDGVYGVYVLFTRDMLEKFPAVYSVAGWDKPGESGSAPASKNLKGFLSLPCVRGENGILDCGRYSVDIKAGVVNGSILLQNTVIANNGVVTEEKSYGRSAGPHLQIIFKDNNLAYVFVLDDEVYQSNINQIYMLGRRDTRLFEEVFNYYPSARFFKVKKL